LKRLCAIVALLALTLSGLACKHRVPAGSTPQPTAYGAAIVESSGGKQVTSVGSPLPQPLVVQVNDEQGNAVPGALVTLSGVAGVAFDPACGLTDASGQFTSNISLAGMAGRYQLVAAIQNKAHQRVEVTVQEIALGYQETLGRELNLAYCDRCHNSESTAERVSNYDNLQVKPHAFSEGETLNKMTEPDLLAIITHGGPGLNKSPLMPAYGGTLSKAEIQALIAYIRAVSDPAYQTPGLIYAKN
jgi:mono/diheme cytochrome c family protein